MGSFTSMPKVIPAADCDDTDLTYPVGREDLDTFLDRCAQQLGSLPAPIERNFRKVPSNDTNIVCSGTGEKIRVLQWNVLSQALGTKNDNFVRCPPSALYWRTRRFRMLEEVARHDADIICLQEVDHFPFLKKSLASLGYTGHFFPKPDSPCLYLAENSGPDGCAIFYKRDKFDLQKVEQRVIEVWHVESNQVVLMTTLRSCATGETFSVATTHLKARNGALLSTLRNEQGKDIMEFISKHVQQSSSSEGSSTPVIVTGDFNAEPTEPVYETMTNADHPLRLSSAYASASPSSSSSSLDKEAPYTTWKIREDGEHIQTLDYIFYSQNRLEVDSVLDFPSGHEIGLNRLPSLEYASDHFSLVADLRILPSPGGKSRN